MADSARRKELEALSHRELIDRILDLEQRATSGSGALERSTFELGERIKELELRHDATRLMTQSQLGVTEVLEALCERIPAGWQWPEITAARIAVDNVEVASHGFAPTPWQLRAPIEAHGQRAGDLEISLLEHRIGPNGEPFLAEEEPLVASLAHEIGAFLEQRRAAEDLSARHEQMLAMFDGFPEIMYVTDPETFEVLFVNRAFADILGEDPVGKICYEAFQGKAAPCEFCTNEQLLANPGEPYTWEHHNPLLGMDFLITDTLIPWPDGRQVRFEVAVDVTERKRAQRELVAEKRFSEAFLESLPGISYMFGTDLRFVRWNTNFARATGYSLDELAELSPMDLFDKDEGQTVAQRIEQVFGSGHAEVEAHLISKDGSRTPYLFTGRRATIEGSTYLVGMGIDASERHEADQRLREAEERFRALFEHAPVGAALLDMEGHPVLTNLALQRIVGYDGDRLAAMQFVEFTHPDDAEIDLHLFQQLIAGEIPEYTMEKRYIHRDGHVVWGDLAVTVIRHDDGSPRYILGMVIDISERKRAERERLVFQRLVEATGQGIGMACLDGTLHYLNPSLREMLGFGPDQQIPDVRIDTFYGNRWKPKVIEQVIPHVLENGRWRGDLEITRLDGTTFPSIESYFLIRDEAGEPLYIGDVITDISEERDVQAVLQAKSAELEQAVSDLERSNAELEQFAYVASHDLQEPLRMVASYLQLLERRYGDTLEGDAREFIDYAVDGATRMKVLINALLEFSRVGTRGQPFEPVDLSSATADVLRRLRPAIEEHGAHVTCETLPTLQADPVQIAQLLQNLVANAIKYRGEATPEIRISAEPYDATAWAISVSDNGIGIEPPYRDQVFEVFRRLHGRDEYPGTGIGLAICRKIVERHGGQIWIEGSPLGGSTFRFIIPSSEETGHDP